MTLKPNSVKLLRCTECDKEQLWHEDGYVITKGWHAIDFDSRGFGKRISLLYPARFSEKVCCESCIGSAIQKYILSNSYGDQDFK
jgi:hypothetical protein